LLSDRLRSCGDQIKEDAGIHRGHGPSVILVQIREEVGLSEGAVPARERLALKAAAWSLSPRFEVELRPEAVGGEVIATVQEDAATLAVVVRYSINECPGQAMTLTTGRDHEMDYADLVSRKVVKQVSADLVADLRREQRPLLRALSEGGVREKPNGAASLLRERQDP
jgi:hypothetical protein